MYHKINRLRYSQDTCQFESVRRPYSTVEFKNNTFYLGKTKHGLQISTRHE